jgi:hypothetical protein
MQEIIETMIQVFKENQNKQMTSEHLIDYYLKNKQLPFGESATEKELRQAIKQIYHDGLIKQSVGNTGTYGKVISYTYVVEQESGQVGMFI